MRKIPILLLLRCDQEIKETTESWTRVKPMNQPSHSSNVLISELCVDSCFVPGTVVNFMSVVITIFDAILTGRQRGQKLQCLFGNLMAIAFSKIEFYTICELQS